MANVLAVVEQRDGILRAVSNELVSEAARVAAELGGEADALALGPQGIGTVAAELGGFGAARILVAERADFDPFIGEIVAPAVVEAVTHGDYAAVFFAATVQGRDLAPRVAALMDVPLATDVVQIDVEDGALVMNRPVYAGKATARVRSLASPALASLRPNAFGATARAGQGTIESWSPSSAPVVEGINVRGFESTGSGLKDLSEASIVVTGGRGMKGPEEWGILEALRDALGTDAALGASRAVVDAGWRSHGEQVGQTGQTVAPKLYFAIGISGAIQHLAGMRTSQTIVAVNKDPDAPIFQVADYGIVGDLFEVVPRITEEIARLNEST